MKRFLVAAICILLATSMNAQYAIDTTTTSLSDISKQERKERWQEITRSRSFQITCIGGGLVLGSLILQDEDVHIRSLRNDYLPYFKNTYDNYTQYLPAAALIAMKAAGVKSRSSWGRMLVSDAFSAALMISAVNIIKTTSHMTRPDGSANNSYPSGHTATAFMTATMFSKEYGPRSKWYSIGAYTVATATGLTRLLNNRHWLTDGLCGAGIGILATELGYYFADLIFKEKGLNLKPIKEEYSINYRPSFIEFQVSFTILPGHYRTLDGKDITFDTGAEAGFEGAWFFNKNWGIGGKLSAANLYVKYDGHRLSANDIGNFTEEKFETSFLDILNAQYGVYFSVPISPRWLVGTKVLAGISYTPKYDLAPYVYGKHGVFSMSSGLSVTYKCKQYLGLKLFMNYTGQQSSLLLQDKAMHLLTFGGSAQIML